MTESLYDLDAWLEGASLTQTSVEILQKPALLSRWDDLQRRYERARQEAPAERSISDPNPLAALEDEAGALLDEIEASRTIWHVRALLPDDLSAILAAHPLPTAPRFAGNIPTAQHSPTDAQAKAFLGLWEAYKIQAERWESEHAEEIDAYLSAKSEAERNRGAEKIARAVVRIEQGGRTVAEAITVPQVITLERRIGRAQLSKIIAAIDEATEAEPEVPAGFLSRGSGLDPE